MSISQVHGPFINTVESNPNPNKDEGISRAVVGYKLFLLSKEEDTDQYNKTLSNLLKFMENKPTDILWNIALRQYLVIKEWITYDTDITTMGGLSWPAKAQSSSDLDLITKAIILLKTILYAKKGEHFESTLSKFNEIVDSSDTELYSYYLHYFCVINGYIESTWGTISKDSSSTVVPLPSLEAPVEANKVVVVNTAATKQSEKNKAKKAKAKKDLEDAAKANALEADIVEAKADTKAVIVEANADTIEADIVEAKADTKAVIVEANADTIEADIVEAKADTKAFEWATVAARNIHLVDPVHFTPASAPSVVATPAAINVRRSNQNSIFRPIKELLSKLEVDLENIQRLFGSYTAFCSGLSERCSSDTEINDYLNRCEDKMLFTDLRFYALLCLWKKLNDHEDNVPPANVNNVIRQKLTSFTRTSKGKYYSSTTSLIGIKDSFFSTNLSFACVVQKMCYPCSIHIYNADGLLKFPICFEEIKELDSIVEKIVEKAKFWMNKISDSTSVSVRFSDISDNQFLETNGSIGRLLLELTLRGHTVTYSTSLSNHYFNFNL
jgi:hypothetical protein